MDICVDTKMLFAELAGQNQGEITPMPVQYESENTSLGDPFTVLYVTVWILCHGSQNLAVL